MTVVFDLPEDFSFDKEWSKTLEQSVFQSIIKDASNDLGWRINWNRKSITPPKLHSAERKSKIQDILTSRVIEQQSSNEYRKNLHELKFKHIDKLLHPNDFDDNIESVSGMFDHVHIEVVESEEQKEIFRFLRHSWRIPYKTTPGRTLSFLVKVGREKKIAGILTLASPALWMSNRDESLGFEDFKIMELSTEKLTEIKEKFNFEAKPLDKKALINQQNIEALEIQKKEWISRWSQLGLKDSSTMFHHLSGCFSVFELLNSSMVSLVKRIRQFPVELISDEEDFATRCGELGISLEGTQPTSWITKTEPNSSAVDKKNIKKRRRIVKECIDAYDTLYSWNQEGFPETIGDLFDQLHGFESKSGSKRMNALKTAMTQSKIRMMSSNIAEMIICGAVPPFNPLRVGKLIAMLSLSSEIKQFWDEAYSRSESDIATELAGRPISKPATLSAVSTTGLYGRSNAQYDRITIPLEHGAKVKFEMAGVTGNKGRGPSTLTISDSSWKLVNDVVKKDGNEEGTTGKFGEGTSARIRRLQKAVKIVNSWFVEHTGLQVKQLLNEITSNPFSRSVHVANLSHNSIRFQLGIDDALSYPDGLSKDRIVRIWKERWLIPLISREPSEKPNAMTLVKNCELDKLLPPYEYLKSKSEDTIQ